jgi:hypothetical protein
MTPPESSTPTAAIHTAQILGWHIPDVNVRRPNKPSLDYI